VTSNNVEYILTLSYSLFFFRMKGHVPKKKKKRKEGEGEGEEAIDPTILSTSGPPHD